MLGLGSILYFALLLINSIAILDERRFLARSVLDADSRLVPKQCRN